MRKFNALFINEMIKLTRRVLIVVGLIALLVIPLLVFVVSKQSYRYEQVYQDDLTDLEYANQKVEEYETRYADIQGMYGDPYEYMDIWSMYDVESYKQQLEVAKEIRDSEPRKLRLVYINSLLNSSADSRAILAVYDYVMDSDLSDEEKADTADLVLNYTGQRTLEEVQEVRDLAAEAINSGTLEAYINFNTRISEPYFNSSYSEEEQKMMQELWAKVEVDEETLYNSQAFGTVERTIDSYIDRQTALRVGTYEGSPLTPQIEKKLTNEMAVILYQIENPEYMNANTGVTNSYYSYRPAATDAFNNAFTFVFLILMIGMMILSASTVSQEIETGTIKALIISPTKRYKIILAKFLALVAVALILFIISIAWIALLSFMFYGADSLPGLLLTVASDVVAFGPVMAAFVRMLICFVQVVMFIIVGMTLSTTLRHTAMAVGLSIGLFFANMIAQLIIMTTRFSETLRLLPFLNIDFSGRIGASIPDMLIGGYFQSHYTYIPLQYSIIYTLIFAFLLLWITFDSFVRRDI